MRENKDDVSHSEHYYQDYTGDDKEENATLMGQVPKFPSQKHVSIFSCFSSQFKYTVFFQSILSVAEVILLFVYGYFVQSIFMLPYCGLLYQCGCTWSWDGGAEHCNAFQKDSKYKCPWCVAPKSSAWLVTYGTALAITIFTFLICKFMLSRLWYHIIARFMAIVRSSEKEPSGSVHPAVKLIFCALTPEKFVFYDYQDIREFESNKNLFILKRWAVWIPSAILTRFIVSCIVFVLYGLVLALIFKWVSGYPYFLFFNYPPSDTVGHLHHEL